MEISVKRHYAGKWFLIMGFAIEYLYHLETIESRCMLRRLDSRFA